MVYSGRGGHPFLDALIPAKNPRTVFSSPPLSRVFLVDVFTEGIWRGLREALIHLHGKGRQGGLKGPDPRGLLDMRRVHTDGQWQRHRYPRLFLGWEEDVEYLTGFITVQRQ